MPRSTRDVDFLGFGRMETDAVASAIRDIINIYVQPDGLEFAAGSIQAQEIREGQDYGGIRVNLVAYLGTARIPLQIDIGSGDVVTPAPERAQFPALLDFPAPLLQVYPAATVVAEKFEAMVSLGLRNTRLKDFHDLWFLSRRFDFDGATLYQALVATFDRRGTALEARPLPLELSFAIDAERQTQWRAFLTRNGLSGPPEKFVDLMDYIRRFIGPILAARGTKWQAGKGWE